MLEVAMLVEQILDIVAEPPPPTAAAGPFVFHGIEWRRCDVEQGLNAGSLPCRRLAGARHVVDGLLPIPAGSRSDES
jgi:hypothetical protein